MRIEIRLFPILLFAFAGLFLHSASHSETRPQPSEAEIGQSAMNGFFRTNDQAYQADRISEAKDIYSARALTSPNDVAGATIIFSKGKDPAALERLLNASNYQLVLVEIKIPFGSAGIVRTLSIGPGELLSTFGTDRQRLEAHISKVREEYRSTARLLEGESADKYTELAQSAFKVYRADVIGQNRQFPKTSMRSDVLGVFPYRSEGIVNSRWAIEDAIAGGARFN